MSLINDALKKAQKQRTGEAPPLASMPGVGGESPHRIARRAKPAGFDTLIMRAGIGAAVVLVLAVGAFLIFRDKPPQANVGSPLAATSRPAQAPTLQPTTDNQEPTAPASTFTLPIPRVETPVTKAEPQAPTVAKIEPPKSAAPIQQPATNNKQPVPVSEPAKPALKLEPRAIQFIENIKVGGIRASASDAKVLMNDRVYRVGSTVEAELGLKLVAITADSLTFEDEKGGRYTRTF